MKNNRLELSWRLHCSRPECDLQVENPTTVCVHERRTKCRYLSVYGGGARQRSYLSNQVPPKVPTHVWLPRYLPKYLTPPARYLSMYVRSKGLVPPEVPPHIRPPEPRHQHIQVFLAPSILLSHTAPTRYLPRQVQTSSQFFVDVLL